MRPFTFIAKTWNEFISRLIPDEGIDIEELRAEDKRIEEEIRTNPYGQWLRIPDERLGPGGGRRLLNALLNNELEATDEQKILV